jgi:hypothetical protein
MCAKYIGRTVFNRGWPIEGSWQEDAQSKRTEQKNSMMSWPFLDFRLYVCKIYWKDGFQLMGDPWREASRNPPRANTQNKINP